MMVILQMTPLMMSKIRTQKKRLIQKEISMRRKIFMEEQEVMINFKLKLLIFQE